MIADTPSALERWCGDYGRYCTLVAATLSRTSLNRAEVLAAATDETRARAIRQLAIYDARQRVTHKLAPLYEAGITREDVARAARQVKETVEKEWCLSIPLVGGVEE